MNTRLLFLDMEGTIYAKQCIQLPEESAPHHHSLWSRLMHECGQSALEADARTIAKWEAGGYRTYLEWCNESICILREHGLTHTLFQNILASIPYNPGVRETIEAIHQYNIKTAIVSGGFIEQARRAQMELQITHSYAAVDLFWNSDGLIQHWNTFPSDYEGKVDFVRLLMREYHLSSMECAFVGDGKNDVCIAKEVGTSFAYQAHHDLQLVATYRIDEFQEILRYL